MLPPKVQARFIEPMLLLRTESLPRARPSVPHSFQHSSRKRLRNRAFAILGGQGFAITSLVLCGGRPGCGDPNGLKRSQISIPRTARSASVTLRGCSVESPKLAAMVPCRLRSAAR